MQRDSRVFIMGEDDHRVVVADGGLHQPPEVAILGVGRTLEVPHRTDDGIGWRRELTLSLTIDHRAVDGAPGAEFLQSLVETLANPSVITGSA